MKHPKLSVNQIKIAARLIKAATGIVGGAVVLTENHPYIALGILATGAVANEYLDILKDEQVKYSQKTTIKNKQ